MKKLWKTLECAQTPHGHGSAEYNEDCQMIKCNLYIQCNPHQNSNDIIHKARLK
jgi:hypothetical protein